MRALFGIGFLVAGILLRAFNIYEFMSWGVWSNKHGQDISIILVWSVVCAVCPMDNVVPRAKFGRGEFASVEGPMTPMSNEQYISARVSNVL